MRQRLCLLHSRQLRQRQQGCKLLHTERVCCGNGSVAHSVMAADAAYKLFGEENSMHRSLPMISRQSACPMHAVLERFRWILGWNPLHAPRIPLTEVDEILQDSASLTDSSPASIVAISSSVGSSDSNTTGCATPRGTQHTAEIMAAASALPQ